MIRFARLFGVEGTVGRAKLAEIQRIFRAAFPAEAEVGDRLPEVLADMAARGAEPIVLYAEDQRGRVLGFDVSLYFADVRLAYLLYIASDPARPARGIGGALYEAMRELLAARGARGLLMDAGPDERAKLKDPTVLETNKRRLAFYARYGALPVEGTGYDVIPNPRNEGYLTYLLYDPLGTDRPLRRAEARKFLVRMLRAQYGLREDDPYVREVVASFRDDPVRLRRPRAARRAPALPAQARLRPIKVVVTPRHEIHHVRAKGYVERPVRVRAVVRGLDGLPVEERAMRRFGEAPIRAVHDPRMVNFLETLSARLGADALLYPEVFPIRRPERRPRELESQMGYYCIDTFTPLTRNVWKAARASVDAALTAAELVAGGERYAYALCRPPGHHAERRAFGGFCYFNNAAVAAHFLSARGRVALLDIDYHHGNGSQEIFYERGDVYVTSIHGSPAYAYPHFAGYADERGAGEGLGLNRNFPLARGVGDGRYHEVLDEALKHVRRFRPEWLVVSLGFDIMRGDPTGSFLVSVQGMRRIGETIGRLGLPTLVVQEGGYTVRNLRRGARAFFEGLGSTWY